MLSYLPFGLSTFAADIDGVIRYIYLIVGVWFVLAELVLFWFILGSRQKAGVRASWQPGTGTAAWFVLGPVAAVLACDLMIEHAGAAVWDKVKIDLPKGDLLVRITARQFSWSFTYAGKDEIGRAHV
jgi:cytochrome c oxidase subunit 2